MCVKHSNSNSLFKTQLCPAGPINLSHVQGTPPSDIISVYGEKSEVVKKIPEIVLTKLFDRPRT